MNKKLAFVTVCVVILLQACASPSPAPVSEPTKTATLLPSTSTPTPTVTPTSTPTPIPLAWTQVYDGQDFERDMVAAFATDKTDPNIIYAGMKNSGVYKTVDEGLSWQPVNQGLVSKKVESLFIDSQNPLVLYAGTVGGIFKTEDGGENWSRVGEGTHLLMDWQDNSHLYARDENTIYETTDQGKNWRSIYTLKKNCPDTISSWAIHPANGSMLFIGGGEKCAGVYQSSDSGHTWSFLGLEDLPGLDPLAIGLDEQGTISIYTNFDPSIPSAGWAAKKGIHFSHDGGVTWSHPIAGGAVGFGDCNILTTDPDNSSIIYCAGTSSLHLIQNKRGAWQHKHIPNPGAKNYTTVHIDHPNGMDRIMASEININGRDDRDIGIFFSVDGGLSWIEKNTGIGATHSELKIDPMNDDRVFLATNYHSRFTLEQRSKYLYNFIGNRNGCTLYRSMDNGERWSSLKIADWCGPSYNSDNAFYLIEWSSLQKSHDGGESWLWKHRDGINYTQYFKEDPVQIANSLRSESQSISANPYIDNLIYAVGNTIYYSLDMGVPQQLSEGSEGLWDARLFYTAQSKMIFAIGRHRQKYSTDNGMTWQACGEDVTTSKSDSRLTLDLQGNKLYLATPGQGVLVSTDKCGSWQESNNGLGNLFVNTVAMDPNNSNIVYAGTDGGAYVTFDGGETWGQINNGLIGSEIIYSIAVDSESNVYAATPYGVFKLEDR